MKRNIFSRYVPIFFFLLFVVLFVWLMNKTKELDFDPKKAYESIAIQLSFGPRFPTSIGHQQEIKYIEKTLKGYGWDVDFQPFTYKNTQNINIIASRGNGKPTILLGAHYDTRRFSDQESDSTMRLLPVPGANDGASGVSILLELARILPNKDIQLVFFDAEDQGDINGWDWSIGSNYYVNNINPKPKKVIILDMVADKDINFFMESFSEKTISSEIWQIGSDLGFSSVFINQTKYSMIDDHRPFIDNGIPAVLIIDFDYPYWHTTKDDLDAISIDSLNIIGSVIYKWIRTNN